MSSESRYSISPIAAAVSAALAAPTVVLAQNEGTSDSLEEIIVTATKREQNLQKIPATIQAIPEAMLKDIGALNTEDYVRFMPSVNWVKSNSGGDNFIVFRGVNTGTSAFTATASASVYLDEIPITATNGSQPDIRMLDVARVEALAGPQGTLFGAAAQSGTLRIITNKPDTSQFEASAEVVFAGGETSDPSHSVTGVFNIPLIEDVFAIRLAAQSAEDGGFVDNIVGHTPDTWFGETAAENMAGGTAAPRSWGAERQGWGTYSNDNLVEENWNSAEHTNIRISARWDINDVWSATGAYHYGKTDSQGSNGYNPYVGDLQTIRFVKDTSVSEWDMASLTIEANFDFGQFVSATSFYENQRTYEIDNTLYYKYYMTRNYCTDKGQWDQLGNAANGYFYYWLWENTSNGRAIYAPLYCVFPTSNPAGDVGQLPDLIGSGGGPEWQDRFTQEFRLTHQGETFDWLAGLYYEESNDSWNSIWMKEGNVPYQDSMSYAFVEECAAGTNADLNRMWNCRASHNSGILGTRGGAAAINAALPTADHYWDSRDNTDWQTKAAFGEITWHATDALNVTIGGRWFETTNDKVYVKWIAGGTDSDDRAAGGFIQPRWIGNDIKQTRTLSEFVPKVTIDWSLSDSKMVYGLFSQGYRPGGINRANKNADWSRTLWGQEWEPDKLNNYELGWRSRFAENTVQLNLTGFYMQWDDYIHQAVDPSSNTCVVPSEENDVPRCASGELPWISIVGNVGDAHITGLTAEVDWVPSDGWTVGANATWLQAEMDSTHPESGIEVGQRTPNHPELQGAAWLSYAWPVRFVPGGEMFIRGQASYSGETLTHLVPRDDTSSFPSFTNDAYTIADLRFGLVSADDGWQIDLFVNNITDERAQITQGGSGWQWGRSGEYDRSHTVNTIRPREIGLRFSARWGN